MYAGHNSGRLDNMNCQRSCTKTMELDANLPRGLDNLE